jgi:hypothetical protein
VKKIALVTAVGGVAAVNVAWIGILFYAGWTLVAYF